MLPGGDRPPRGMWQVPQQFDCMVHAVRAALDGRAVRRSVTVGTWSGWTDLVLVALLRRLGGQRHAGGRAHTHATFDIEPKSVSPCIRELFARQGITQVRHGWYGGNESWKFLGLGDAYDGQWPARWRAPVLDFCLIDGGHGFPQVSRDLRTLREACRVIVFHDIVNARGWDVPRFWRTVILDEASPSHPAEFAAQECTYQPPLSDGQLMGIGVLVRKELLNRTKHGRAGRRSPSAQQSRRLNQLHSRRL